MSNEIQQMCEIYIKWARVIQLTIDCDRQFDEGNL